MSKTTHFGYQTIGEAEKTSRVREIFDSVADRYDLMNDLMSLGVHRLWKRFALNLANIRPGQAILDLAGGTGDLAGQMTDKVGSSGQVVLCDINAAMLSEGRQRLTDRGLVGNLSYIQADAEALPFANNSFDCISMAFGLRNVTRKENALMSIYRVLKPGGRVVILEFSHPALPELKPAYDLYSFAVLPLLGQLVAGDAASYRYLAESIRMHPNQETLKTMIEQAGFERCDYYNLSGGIVAVHCAYKY